MTPEDIDAFEAKHAANIEAAREFVRRSLKGIPRDRWAHSDDMLRDVAEGIRAMDALMAMLTQATDAMARDIERRGVQATTIEPER
ncbi:UNVERIFIED_CONTAM: hypothetical protein BEN50_19110 [Euhalothece sp. KZN 001]